MDLLTAEIGLATAIVGLVAAILRCKSQASELARDREKEEGR